MVSISENVDTQTESAVDELLTEFDSVLTVTSENTIEEFQSLISETNFYGNNSIIYVADFKNMDSEFQKTLSEQLKGMAESYPVLKIIVAGVNSTNKPTLSNSDLSGRVYPIGES